MKKETFKVGIDSLWNSQWMYKEFVITSFGDMKSVSQTNTTLSCLYFTISYSNETWLAGKQIDADHVKIEKGILPLFKDWV